MCLGFIKQNNELLNILEIIVSLRMWKMTRQLKKVNVLELMNFHQSKRFREC